MGERTKLGLGVIGVALVLGVLGDVLLRATPWGVNFLIWVTALVGLAVLLARWGRVFTGGEGRWLVFVAVVFAAGLVVRDSPVVVVLDVMAVLISLSLAVWRGRGGSLRRAGISDYIVGGAVAGTLTSAGPLPVCVADIEWREALRGRWKGQALALTRGVLLAAPLLVLFGALFVAADAIFERLVIDVFGFDLAEVFTHLFLICSLAWITSGLLWAGLMASLPEDLTIPRPRVVSLGIVEVGVVLGLLDLLFLTFVVIQVRYLFGGAGHLAATSGLTYAEYARHGFFELVAVTALALPAAPGRPLAAQGRKPCARDRVQVAGRGHGRPALRHRGLRVATHVPLPERVRPDRAAPVHHHIYALDLDRPRLVRCSPSFAPVATASRLAPSSPASRPSSP